MSDVITKEVLDASELKEGQMKAVDVGDGKVLLSNIGGKIVGQIQAVMQRWLTCSECHIRLLYPLRGTSRKYVIYT